MLYELIDCGNEHKSSTIFEGPKVPDWKIYCDSLIEEALSLNETCSQFTTLIELLKKILKKKGYKVLNFPVARYFTDCGCTFHDKDKDGISKRIQEEGISKSVADKLVINFINNQIIFAELMEDRHKDDDGTTKFVGPKYYLRHKENRDEYNEV